MSNKYFRGLIKTPPCRPGVIRSLAFNRENNYGIIIKEFTTLEIGHKKYKECMGKTCYK